MCQGRSLRDGEKGGKKGVAVPTGVESEFKSIWKIKRVSVSLSG